MFTAPELEVLDTLYKSRTTRILRARRSDGQHVILKGPATSPAAPRLIARLHHEHQILKDLDLPGVIRSYGICETAEGPVLLLEDIGGQSLRGLLARGPLPLRTFLEIAIQVTTALGALHEAGVIHKDLNPTNIVVNTATGRVQIIDAGIATRLPREAVRSPNQLEGTLPYLSPEQTGRMNRAIDHRSDFYALGMTFYELLTGQLAFRTGDPLELVHCHIAQAPVPPHQLDPRVPRVLSAMVMKLVGKTAEERYQSAFGILADLQRCLQLLDEEGEGEDTIRDFPIAERDRPRRLELPQKLYGREAELAALRAAFERACSGGSDGRGAAELVLVSGYSGIGKSSLVAELHKPVLARRGYFVSGKFDALKRSVPYAALSQALGQLVHQLLLEGEERRAQWRGKVAQALAADAPLLAALVPELALLLGSQPADTAAPALDSGEAQQKLNAALQRLFGLFAAAGCPLVLVLDDLQWADAASLGLLQALFTAAAAPPLLCVGIYRDNEVGPLHPLILTLDAVRKTTLEIRHLTLKPLGRADLVALLCDTLRCAPDEAEPLAALLEGKTEGNPFFLGQLLASLYRDGLLRFDPGSGRWTWSLEQLQRASITSNVVELLVAKLEQLPDETREILETASCLGSEFELGELAAVYERSPEQTAAALWQALREGLVAPLGDSFAAQVYARPDAAPWATTERVRYRFLHDRVQQAAYEQIPPIERAALHLKIGRLRWQQAEATTAAPDERLFDLLDHLEAGIALVHSAKERLAIARLLLRGGIKAKGALAHELALRLLQLAAQLVPADPLAVPADFHNTLLREQAACAILLGRYDEAEALLGRALAAARTPAERLDAYIQRITLFQRSARYGDALHDGIACLRLYDLELNSKASAEDVERLIREMKDALGERKPEALLELPAMTDPDKRALLQVLSSLIAAAWMAGVHVFHSLCMNMGILSIRYGNAPQSAFAYVYAGMVLAVRGDHALGYELGRLACLLVEKDPSCDLRGRVLFVYGMNLQYRRHPIRGSLQTLLAAYRECIAANDLLYAPWCGQALVNTLFSMGQSLREAHGEMSKWLAYARATNAAGTVDGIVSVGRFFARLLELPAFPALAGESDGSDEAEFEEALLSNPQAGFQFAHFHAKSLLHYVLGDYAAAFAAIQGCKPWLPSASMLQEALDHAFYESLIRAALATEPSCDLAQRDAHVIRMRELVAPIRTLRAHAPMNFLHKELLIDAELARLSGDGGELARAQDLYDQAIAQASAQGFLHHAAIANECAARHYLRLGKTTIAGAYLSEAYEFYSRWGARKKLATLLAQHPSLIRSERLRRTAPGTGVTPVTTLTTEDLVGLDLLTVTKAAQAISGEIQLERLLAQLMRIVLESAGAERGLLLLRHGEQLRVEAAGRTGGEVEVLRSLPLRGRTDLSEAIVEYVARTGESVVLSHAAQEGAYAADPYIAASRTRSLLCIPAYHHGKLVAVVYLENNLAAGSFTADRVELLQILSAQMAISIDNARLYANLEEKVRERTAELQKAQARLLLLEREATERQLAGGFAHEMRNALAGPKVLLADVLGLGLGDGEQDGLPLGNARLLRQIYTTCAPKLDEAGLAELKGLLRRVYANEERLDEVLHTVHKAVARGLNTTQRILDYSRTGNESTPPQRLDLNAVCSEVRAELESTLSRHGVRLHSELAQDLPAILGRRPQLYSVLENLILNSRDALIGPAGRPEPDDSGAPRAEPPARLISLRTRRSGSAIEVEVSDNGSGIAPEHLPRIFEPFFSTKPDTGTGLGLALVKKVVSLHQGDIRVQSAPERGTQVTITLPLGAAVGEAR
ncbi:MAG: AAA family ATPase [Polyangia bacterium]